MSKDKIAVEVTYSRFMRDRKQYCSVNILALMPYWKIDLPSTDYFKRDCVESTFILPLFIVWAIDWFSQEWMNEKFCRGWIWNWRWKFRWPLNCDWQTFVETSLVSSHDECCQAHWRWVCEN